MTEISEKQQRRLDVVRFYNAYVSALRSSHADLASDEIQRSRRALAHAIERACEFDDNLLSDFRRAFTASHPR